MEAEKAYIKRDNTTVIKCPHCRLEKTISVEEIKGRKKILKVKCSCKNVYNVSLEFRKMYRKETELKGRYINLSHENDENIIIVSNISMRGVGFCISNGHKIAKGNKLRVEFRIDDKRKTFIGREVVVKVVRGNYIGAEFINVDEYDKFLGYYLAS